MYALKIASHHMIYEKAKVMEAEIPSLNGSALVK